MQLSEEKTYRTRDGRWTGIRVKNVKDNTFWPWEPVEKLSLPNKTKCGWTTSGRWWSNSREDEHDLIEETPPPSSGPQPFSYDACLEGPDGRKRAVTRDEREVVLLCDDAPGDYPIKGYELRSGIPWQWKSTGEHSNLPQLNILIPPPAKRIVWVNLYETKKRFYATGLYASEAEADAEAPAQRLGNRAYPIEIDE